MLRTINVGVSAITSYHSSKEESGTVRRLVNLVVETYARYTMMSIVHHRR